MRYATATAFRQALEQRLLDHAQVSGQSLLRLRKNVAFDRLLARLLVVAPDRWVLKGALALDYRLGRRARTTKDIDLVRRDDVAAATMDFLAVQTCDLDDYFTFAIELAADPDPEREQAVARYRARAEVGRRLFEDVTIDVVFGRAATSPPDYLTGSTLLSFADVPPIIVPVLALEEHIAEKLHAYVRLYHDGRRSSRVKDLVDLAIIAESSQLDASYLRAALERTFTIRTGAELPPRTPPPPDAWSTPYRRLARDVGITIDMGAAYQAVARMLDPVLAGMARGIWDPAQGEWLPAPDLWR